LPDISKTFNSIGVIVGRDLIGDALIKLPFLRALRCAYPKAEIHWITSQGPTAYAGPLRDATRAFINIIHECPPWVTGQGSVAPAKYPASPFDLLIDTRNRWRDALVASHIPHGLFLAPAARFLFSEKRPPFFRARPKHMVDRLLQTVELAAGYIPPSTGALPASPALEQLARKILPEGHTYVGFVPGAGNRIKIWPRYKFEVVAALQAAKGRVPVFILGPQEALIYDTIIAAVPAAKFPLQDKIWGGTEMTVDHTLAVARYLNVAVANDSGAGHMLAAADCPLISLFGPTSPEKLAPRVSRGRIIRAQDFGSAQMKAITWEAVDTAIDDMLRHF